MCRGGMTHKVAVVDVLVLVACVRLSAAGPVPVFAPWDGPGDTTHPGMNELPCWRIPALVHLTDQTTTGAPNDSLMMFAEGRWYNGDGCNAAAPPSNPPAGPVSAGCQTKLDAVCNDKENAPCIDATVKIYGNSSLPLVGLYDRALQGGKAWRCYSVLGLDSTRKHWNGSFPGYSSEDGSRLASVYDSQCSAHHSPSPPAHPRSPPGAARAIFSRKSTDCASHVSDPMYLGAPCLTTHCSLQPVRVGDLCNWSQATRQQQGSALILALCGTQRQRHWFCTSVALRLE